MTAKTFFKFIDYSMNPIQNIGYKSFVKKHNIDVTCDIVYDDEFPDVRRGDIYKKKEFSEKTTETDESAKAGGDEVATAGGDESAAKKLPVFINFHGGGFVAGDKRFRRYFSAFVASVGYAVFNVNYGVGPENMFPFCLQSVAKAITWVAENADKYNFDVSKVVLSGDSAGANLAALGGVITTVDGFAESIDAQKPPIKPAGLMLYCGPYDMDVALNTKAPFDLVNKMMLEMTGYSKENIYDNKYINEFSPLSYITSEYPKTFLVYSLKDIFCKHHGEILEEKLKKEHIEVESFHSTTLLDNHCFHLNHSFKAAKLVLNKSKDFLEEIIK
ncbi:MAG: alpha/beta hydrolase [Clostridiales bacterium]|jgi:acetyl esterase/lipase|nr:alpha/beta hydrolase [Clostridiales bacterium]